MNALTKSNQDCYTLQLSESQIETEIFNRTWDKIIGELYFEKKSGKIQIKCQLFETLPSASASRITRCFKQVCPAAPENVKNLLLQKAEVIKELYKNAWIFSLDKEDIRISCAFSKFSIPYSYPLIDEAVLTHDDLYYLGLKRGDDSAARDEAFDSLAWAVMKARLPSMAAKIKEIYLSSTGEIDLESCGFRRTAEDPVPGDIVLYCQEGKRVQCGVFKRDDLVLFKEKEGVFKRKIWHIYPQVQSDVYILKGGARVAFEVETVEKLSRGLNVTDPLIDLIGQVASGLTIKKENGFQIIKGKKVFKHSNFPHLIIKMASDDLLHYYDAMKERFENIIQAERICRIFNFNLLVIPRVKKIEIQKGEIKFLFLIEELLDVAAGDPEQDAMYKKYSGQFDETARQIALFVAETGFHDVIPRNLPILKEKEDYQGDRRVGMIDLEHVKAYCKSGGFWGSNNSYGVIGCLYTEKQIDAALEIAEKYQIRNHSVYDKKIRMMEIESGRRLFE